MVKKWQIMSPAIWLGRWKTEENEVLKNIINMYNFENWVKIQKSIIVLNVG
ncbi:hypothetical protein C1645_782757 [Glomus cerebriforme]|uniref:Uncharacterized protein n=1 Tax=Glomus cerebriforme TaxID=658196 RepID=A0A397SM58_9GLOM|nr:hypothetical protein C1645_782757 [Glomus cerebriforme]